MGIDPLYLRSDIQSLSYRRPKGHENPWLSPLDSLAAERATGVVPLNFLRQRGSHDLVLEGKVLTPFPSERQHDLQNGLRVRLPCSFTDSILEGLKAVLEQPHRADPFRHLVAELCDHVVEQQVREA